jgi:hypothetical protein
MDRRNGKWSLALVIVGALCACQRACDRVGIGRPYGSYFDCLTQMRAAVRADLTALDCPRGEDATRTQPCMTEIERTDCSHDAVSLGTLVACRADALRAR